MEVRDLSRPTGIGKAGSAGKEENMNDRKSHRDLLVELIDHIRSHEVPFYRKAARANYFGWHLLIALSIVLSAAVSLIAALTHAEHLKDAFIIGATVTAFLQSFGFHEREKNREIGLIEAERLLRKGESIFASANTDDEYRKGYLELTDKIATLSHDQHALDVNTRKGINPAKVAGAH